MKKIILGMAVLAALSLSAFTTVNPINETVIKEFKKTYPEASQVKWYQGTDYYQVSFLQGETRSVIYFNKKDHIYRTLRYYGEDQLPPFITLKINERYKNKKIKGITELSDTNTGLSYQIVLEDARHLFIVKSDDYGNLKTTKKLKKSS